MARIFYATMAHLSSISSRFLLITFIVILSSTAKTTSRETLETGNKVDYDWNPHNPPPPPQAICPPPLPLPMSPPPPSPPPPSPPPPSPPPPSPPPPPPPPPSPPNLDPSQFIDVRIYQAYKVIQQFKATITDDPLNITKTWVGADVCNAYSGFYCTDPPYNKSAITLAAIDFNGFQLRAPSVTEFISQLPDLAFFHANSNKFSGTVSANISKLPYFYELDLSNNELTGPFPLAVLSITNLTFLDLRFNSFSGPIPAKVFTRKTFPQLEVLFLNNNKFKFRIPYSIGETPVNYLTLANNEFTGSIPKTIGGLSKTLIEVLFLNNQLSGCIPYEVGLLKESTVFDAGYNQLTGLLPCSLGCLQKVEQLNFAGNFLYGHIPEVVCKLGNLLNLSLSDNYFTWVGPACRELIKKGLLDDRMNCIPGRPSQRPKEECIAFFSRPLFCPHFPWYDYIPCQHLNEGPSLNGSTAPEQSPSYSARVKH